MEFGFHFPNHRKLINDTDLSTFCNTCCNDTWVPPFSNIAVVIETKHITSKFYITMSWVKLKVEHMLFFAQRLPRSEAVISSDKVKISSASKTCV
jgi:hypothetical protein